MARPATDRRFRLVRARRDVVPPAVRRWYSAGGRRSRLGRVGAHVVAGLRRRWLVVAVTAVVVGAAVFVLLGTPVLGVREVSVTGATIAGTEKVRSVAAVPRGTPLARVDTDAVADRVRALPSVSEVDVSRSWPSTLVIAVTERHPVAVVQAGPQYVVLDPTGVVFNRVPSRPAGVILLAVAAPGPQDEPTRAGLHVIGSLTPALRRVVKRVVAGTAADITVELTDGRLIVWGDDSQSEKKAQVATALLDRASKRIDVSAPDVVAVS